VLRIKRPTAAKLRKLKEERRIAAGLEPAKEKTIEEVLAETRPMTEIMRELQGDLH
jgi:hypothetical protein